ncbi:hypothetical protein L596_013754 [Steinernema carpocapsae]|uniref:Peptidase S1 domain-containing protein n=1 Tax=Steinernema carpocapsae TaxID=34508 RepID=A0A4U5P1L3_STECR|nr:hypothetical protein L596_013754 [Steinernema carpocapsae]
MLPVVAILAFLGVVSSVPAPSELIFGGYNSVIGQWPWFALIDITEADGTKETCGGALISKRHVVTAAHCLADKPKTILVWLGVVDRMAYFTTPGMQLRQTFNVVSHPEYEDGLNFYNDIAIVELNTEINITDTVAPISILADDSMILTQPEAFVIGFGTYEYDENNKAIMSHYLRYTNMSISDFDYCKKQWRTGRVSRYPVDLWEKQFCAGADGHGVGPSDSGGPLQMKKDDKWYQVGLVSLGMLDSINGERVMRPNQEKYPAIYTRMSKYCDFMKETTGNAFECV